MTFYGTMVAGHGWIVPKKYIEKVGDDGFKKHPIGLGPYKFVSHTPGVELVLEAYEGYWRKMPSVKRLVFKSVPESTTRAGDAQARRDRHRLSWSRCRRRRRSRATPTSSSRSRAASRPSTSTSSTCGTRSRRGHDQRVRQAASLAIDRKTLNEAETLGQSRRPAASCRASSSSRASSSRTPYDPARPRSCWPRPAIPNGFDAGDLHPFPPYTSIGEAVNAYLQAVGIRTRIRTMERATFMSEWGAKKLKGVCLCITGVHGNAATRMSQYVPSDGTYAYGGWPDVDALFKQQSQRDRPQEARGAAAPDPDHAVTSACASR